MRKINLATAFSTAINLPRLKDSSGDFALYPHAEGSKVQMRRSSTWYKRATTTYNSPSNVRVVCLSRDAANVLYWAPPMKGGNPVLQKELASYYTLDAADKASIKQTINPLKYQWENAGLQCLVNPVVISNLEELWIAVEVFACPKYASIYNKLSGLKNGQVVSADVLLGILEQEISTPSKPRTVKDTFPLLRSIVVGKAPAESSVDDFHKYAARTNEVKAILEAESPGKRRAVGESPAVMKNLAALSGFGFAVCPVLTGDITKFSLGDYKFDEKYLVSYKNAIIKKYSTSTESTVVETAPPVVVPAAETKASPEPVYEDAEWCAKVYRMAVVKFKTMGIVIDGDLVEIQDNSGYALTHSFSGLSVDGRRFRVKFGRVAPVGIFANNPEKAVGKGCVHVSYRNLKDSLSLKGTALVAKDIVKYVDDMAQFVQKTLSAEDGKESTESSSAQGSLLEVINVMESEFSDVLVIKQALYAYKSANPSFFKQQVEQLPQNVRKKYAAVFQ